ncbi:3-hydroxyacyl-CoA dehydrogenase [Streptomyces sp. NPDC020875]|uniref:3-hydroxyacyl-CoA dehydrogenase n=1 Tax=Streptomyces sp. NPDC020875 TaxID=3154898 RepID=UPI0033E526DE
MTAIEPGTAAGRAPGDGSADRAGPGRTAASEVPAGPAAPAGSAESTGSAESAAPLPLGALVAVVGAGTMGRGIAQVALAAGHPVHLYDQDGERAAEAVKDIGARLDRLVEKGRMDAVDRDAARSRLRTVDSVSGLADAALVVEAVAEDLEVKQNLFRALEVLVAEDCLFATNTSSLSVTAVAGALGRPERLVGLHFFNPAPLMPLVEVVGGRTTGARYTALARATVEAWGKIPVASADEPGFIVNRVARPFYAEAFALYEERAADPATIDAVLRECGGFPMGPFELTDLIGQDVNEAVTRSVWNSFFQSPKFVPSLAQRRLVEAGLLGRKTGHGWYDHTPGAERPLPQTAEPVDAPPYVTVGAVKGLTAELAELVAEAGIDVREGNDGRWRPGIELPGGGFVVPVTGAPPGHGREWVQVDLALDYRAATRVAIAPAPTASARTADEAVGLFQALGKKVSVVADVPGLIVARTVAMLIDIAADAVARGVASEADVDRAMRHGAGHPVGPFGWERRLPPGWAYHQLEEMHGFLQSGRYAPGYALYRRTFQGEGADG